MRINYIKNERHLFYFTNLNQRTTRVKNFLLPVRFFYFQLEYVKSAFEALRSCPEHVSHTYQFLTRIVYFIYCYMSYILKLLLMETI